MHRRIRALHDACEYFNEKKRAQSSVKFIFITPNNLTKKLNMKVYKFKSVYDQLFCNIKHIGHLFLRYNG